MFRDTPCRGFRRRIAFLMLTAALAAYGPLHAGPAGFLAFADGQVVGGQVVAKSASAGRDWQAHPAVVQLPATTDVYALGDVHGDYGRLVNLLVKGGLIAEKPEEPGRVRWSAGKAVLVCTGDLIDKGDHSLKVIALFRALSDSAEKAGGRVVVTMGNHEAEFLADPKNDQKAIPFRKELKDAAIDVDEVAAGTDPSGIGAFLRSLPFAARVNDSWFFAHAGNTKGRTLDELDAALRSGVDVSGYKAEILSDPDSLLEARLHPTPWWVMDEDTPKESRARLAEYLEKLGVKHLVIGHQAGDVEFPDGDREAGKMFQEYDGMIFLIDVGMSRAPKLDHSKGALLRIRTGPAARATIIHHDGKREPLWPKK
jgi:Calcineurin-like phosphoesterase